MNDKEISKYKDMYDKHYGFKKIVNPIEVLPDYSRTYVKYIDINGEEWMTDEANILSKEDVIKLIYEDILYFLKMIDGHKRTIKDLKQKIESL